MNLDYYNQLLEARGLFRLQNASEDGVKNAFFANYLTSLVLLKLQDIKGLMLINDPHHARLTKFSADMSDLNFWGRALFYSKEPEIKNRMLPRHAALLAHESGRIVTSRIMKTMQVPLTAPEKIDWHETVGALLLFRERFSIESSYFQKITTAVARWEAMTELDHKRAINYCFMYLMQSDPGSALLPRLRALSSTTMLGKATSLVQKIVSFKRIVEDGEGGDGGTSTGNIGSVQGSSNAIITPPSFDQMQDNGLGNLFKFDKTPSSKSTKKVLVIKDGKIIRKKVKGFKPRKFKAPTLAHNFTKNEK